MKKIFMICCIAAIGLTAANTANAVPAIKNIRVKNSNVVLNEVSYPIEKNVVQELKMAHYAYVLEIAKSGGADWATLFSYADGTFGISYDNFDAFFNNEEMVFVTYPELTKKEFKDEEGIAGWAECDQPWRDDTKVKYVFSHKGEKAYIIVYGR